MEIIVLTTVINRWLFVLGCALVLVGFSGLAYGQIQPARAIIQLPPPHISTPMYDSSDSAFGLWSVWQDDNGTYHPEVAFGVSYRGTLRLSLRSFVPEIMMHLHPAGPRLGFVRLELGGLPVLVPVYEDLTHGRPSD